MTLTFSATSVQILSGCSVSPKMLKRYINNLKTIEHLLIIFGFDIFRFMTRTFIVYYNIS